MANLFNTDKVNGHSHVVYVKNDGSGVSDSLAGHVHNVIYEQVETPEGVVPTGPPILEEANGHTHELTEFEVSDKPEKTKNAVQRVVALYKEFKNNESESRKKAEESYEFVFNEQWEKDVKAKLKAEDRSYLTLNQIAPNIRLLSGHQRQNRTDIRYFPVEEGDGRVADVLTALGKNITEQSDYPFEETLVFEDQLIAGRGLFNIRIDRSQHLDGKIVIEKYPWDEVFFGPHEKFDLSDCEALIKTKWFSKDKIKQMWPNKAKEIQRTFDDLDKLAGDEPHLRVEGKQYALENNTSPLNILPSDIDMVNMKRKEFRVLELNEKIYINSTVIFDPINDFYFNAEFNGLKAKDLEKAMTIESLNIAPQRTHKIKQTTIAGSVVLEEKVLGKNILPDNDFDIIPAYASKKGNMFVGKVEDVKDAQREINKRHSQTADTLNRHATYIWLHDSNTFENQADAKAFKENASKPGAVLKIRDINRPPVKIEGAKFPSELINFAQVEQEQLQFILNINPELRGFQGDATSGVAIVEKNRQGLLGNEYLFDNLSFAKKILGRKLVAYIQEVYTPERIIRILSSAAQRGKVEIGGENMLDIMNPDQQTNLTPEFLIDLLKNTDLTKYDVVVGESAFTVTNRRANFLIWSQMASTGFPVPPELLVDLSDLPDKDKVKARITQMQQQQAESDERDRQTEITKTQIAAQSRQQGQQDQAMDSIMGGMA